MALELGQPYPGDDNLETNPGKTRFCIYRVSDDQYVVMDSEVQGDSHLINEVHLQNSHFKLGLWYAQKRLGDLNIDPLGPMFSAQYTDEIGDGLLTGALLLLEHAYWDGLEVGANTFRFHVQNSANAMVTIMDGTERLQVMLPRVRLLDQEFDLVNWYRAQVAECQASNLAAGHDFASVSESDAEIITYDSSSVPVAEWSKDEKHPEAREINLPRCLGNLLEKAVSLILEVSQPFPGASEMSHFQEILRMSFEAFM
jgi:hypothetical protein